MIKINKNSGGKLRLICVVRNEFKFKDLHLSLLKTKEIDQQKELLIGNIKQHQKEINGLKQNLRVLSEVDEDDENIEKLNRLEQQYKDLLLQTVETKLTSQRELNQLENRLQDIKMKQNNIVSIYNDLKNAEKVDFCFLIDCTSSMTTYLTQVTETINDIVNTLVKRFKNFEIRFALIGYRDFSEKDDRIVKTSFIDDTETFKLIVSSIEAFGGGDECEDVFGGLFEVSQLDWSNITRVLFHICDAPCHGKRFHSNCEDYYPKGDPKGLKIEYLLQKIQKLNLNYFFADINSKTKLMIEEFNKSLNQDNKIKTVQLNQSLNKVVSEAIVSTITQVTKTLVSNKKIKKRVLNPTIPDWNDLTLFKRYTADFFTVNFLEDLSEIKTRTIDYRKSESQIWLYHQPFSRGALRFAYASVLNIGSDDDHCLLNSVIKESVFLDPSCNTKKYHEESIEIQNISSFLANRFSKRCKSRTSLRFLDVDLIRIQETGVFYSIEEFVEGIFKKWTNNEGNVNEDEYADLLNAFSHWTYVETEEYLLVTDLQGFKYKNEEYILTDPAILCSEDPTRFGKTNLGLNGIKTFFEKHQCNEICRNLKLKKHLSQVLQDI